jgi:hypothetical protein
MARRKRRRNTRNKQSISRPSRLRFSEIAKRTTRRYDRWRRNRHLRNVEAWNRRNRIRREYIKRGMKPPTLYDTRKKLQGVGRTILNRHMLTDKKASPLVCAMRKERKEIMFAKNKAGKSGQKPARWNQQSKLKCKE